MVALLTVSTAAGVGAAQADTSFEPAAQQTPSNNTTVQHERPSVAAGSGDSQRVSQWLERRLAGRLQGSAINISQEQYDQARGALGENYSSRLGQYVDVASETEDDSDDRASETFQQAQQTQQAYANATQEYRETNERYEQARNEGNTTAARQAARELETLSERAQRLNASLQRDYRTITNRTGVNTTEAQRSVTNTTAEILTQQAIVREQTFVETRLTVRTNGSTVAFNDPMGAAGQIRTENGTALQNVTGRIAIGDRSYTVTTDDEGRFRISYRPVSLLVNATTTRVQFLPASRSAYLRSAATVSVAVTQVTPRLEIASGRDRGGYGDSLETTVVATVDGRPVPALPIRARLGGTVVSGRTTDAGRVTLSPRVPADLPAAEQSLQVAHARPAVAVGPNATTTTVIITETETNLTVNTTNDGSLRVRGRLTTADGDVVSAQPIQLTVGETVRSVKTNATGWYRLTVGDVSELVPGGNATVGVTARFDGTGTNLQSSQGRTTFTVQDVDIGSPSGSGVVSGSGQPTALLIGGLVCVLILSIAGMIGWSRRETDSASAATESIAGEADTSTDSGPDDQSGQWLERAHSALETADHERAVVTAYGAVRNRLEQAESLNPTLTHREFLAASGTQLLPAERAALSTVATAYESAVFRGDVDDTAAAAAVEAAAELFSDGNEPPA